MIRERGVFVLQIYDRSLTVTHSKTSEDHPIAFQRSLYAHHDQENALFWSQICSGTDASTFNFFGTQLVDFFF